MSDRLKLLVPEVWEQWAERRLPFVRDPERPQRLQDAIPLQVGRWPRLWLPSGHIILPPMRGGARLFVSASTQYLENNTAPVTAAPFTMACWGRTDDATIWEVALGIVDKDVGTAYWELMWAGPLGGDPLRFRLLGGGEAYPTTTTGFSVNVWAHGCAVEASTTDHRVFINGGSKGTSTASVSPAGADRISIGRSGLSIPGFYFSGDLAEAAVWNVALTDGDVALLAKAVSPLMVRPESLVFYCPIIGNYSPEIEVRKGVNMTVTGATKSAHPRIFYPAMPPQIREFSTTAIPAQIEHRQSVDATGGVTTIVLTLTSVAAGSLLVATAAMDSVGRTFSIADDKGNTWNTSGPHELSSGHGYFFYAYNAVAGTTVVTITISSAGAGFWGSAHEYSGIATAAAIDQGPSYSTGTSTTPTSNALTTTQADELLFAMAWNPGTGRTYSGGAGYTPRTVEPNGTDAGKLATEDRIVAATGAYTATFSVPTSVLWGVVFATFKAAAGGVTHNAEAVLSAAVTIAPSATATYAAAAAVSGAVTVSPLARLTANALAALDVSTVLSPLAQLTANAGAAFSVAGAVSPLAALQANAGAVLDATVVLVANPGQTLQGEAVLATSVGVTPLAQLQANALAALSAAVMVSPLAGLQANALVALAVAAALSPLAQLQANALAVLSAAVTLAPLAVLQANAVAALPAAVSLSPLAQLQANGVAALNTSATLAALASLQANAGAILAITFTITALASVSGAVVFFLAIAASYTPTVERGADHAIILSGAAEFVPTLQKAGSA